MQCKYLTGAWKDIWHWRQFPHFHPVQSYIGQKYNRNNSILIHSSQISTYNNSRKLAFNLFLRHDLSNKSTLDNEGGK